MHRYWLSQWVSWATNCGQIKAARHFALQVAAGTNSQLCLQQPLECASGTPLPRGPFPPSFPAQQPVARPRHGVETQALCAEGHIFLCPSQPWGWLLAAWPTLTCVCGAVGSQFGHTPRQSHAAPQHAQKLGFHLAPPRHLGCRVVRTLVSQTPAQLPPRQPPSRATCLPGSPSEGTRTLAEQVLAPHALPSSVPPSHAGGEGVVAPHGPGAAEQSQAPAVRVEAGWHPTSVAGTAACRPRTPHHTLLAAWLTALPGHGRWRGTGVLRRMPWAVAPHAACLQECGWLAGGSRLPQAVGERG